MVKLHIRQDKKFRVRPMRPGEFFEQRSHGKKDITRFFYKNVKINLNFYRREVLEPLRDEGALELFLDGNWIF